MKTILTDIDFENVWYDDVTEEIVISFNPDLIKGNDFPGRVNFLRFELSKSDAELLIEKLGKSFSYIEIIKVKGLDSNNNEIIDSSYTLHFNN